MSPVLGDCTGINEEAMSSCGCSSHRGHLLDKTGTELCEGQEGEASESIEDLAMLQSSPPAQISPDSSWVSMQVC